ncbi:aspartate kinase [Pseudogracilibacillus auburnensis]|uniref:Aspartokinase n=1 Tax=Pseudogracilibacillus auburnensis TaxID=1494959 RepID=A0A2V3VTJ4_9BACI|nr:aspartate kinase [Pseudogracilibacillus auburnensis]MBO1004314.1 aspartate kinase [Pseudogracilibacillus auburnensis]PXW85066.1 aspartate kinase [Pseudogracilibacillus auburnensis]
MKVAKFGGSSVADANQFRKVGNIIKEDDSRKLIVVSAPGKRHEHDVKMTDLLIRLGNAYVKDEKYKSYLITIMDRFSKIISELKLSDQLTKEIEDKLHSIMTSDLAYDDMLNCFKAVGEDSSAKILSAYLQSLGIDAKYVNPKDAGIIVKNDPCGAQLLPESFEAIYELRQEKGILVIPGFFGYTTDGILATFSRGGSDITGSIIAAGVKAELYENFTDVDSVYSVNPSIINNPKEIKVLTYREMRELSYAGFSVFHDEALIPAFNAHIPVCIKNTNNPSAPGTMIVANKKPNSKCVVGIASDSGFSSFYISKFLMNRELGFGRKLFQILEEEEVSFEHAPSGIDDMSIIIRDSQLTEEKEAIIVERFNKELQADIVTVHRDLALIMIVGEGMKETIGMAQTATRALGEAKVNIEMINQGSSEVSMMFGIKSNDLHRAIKSLYNAFFE